MVGAGVAGLAAIGTAVSLGAVVHAFDVRPEVAEQIATLRVPTTVVLGDADSIVPPEQSRAVAAAAAELHRLVEVPGADHNDRVLLDGDALVDAVVELAGR